MENGRKYVTKINFKNGFKMAGKDTRISFNNIWKQTKNENTSPPPPKQKPLKTKTNKQKNWECSIILLPPW